MARPLGEEDKSSPGILMLSDFGFASTVSAAKIDNAEVQSPIFRAPENFVAGEFTRCSDVRSAALVICQIVGWAETNTCDAPPRAQADSWQTYPVLNPCLLQGVIWQGISDVQRVWHRITALI